MLYYDVELSTSTTVTKRKGFLVKKLEVKLMLDFCSEAFAALRLRLLCCIYVFVMTGTQLKNTTEVKLVDIL